LDPLSIKHEIVEILHTDQIICESAARQANCLAGSNLGFIINSDVFAGGFRFPRDRTGARNGMTLSFEYNNMVLELIDPDDKKAKKDKIEGKPINLTF
jgi:hypothetical protein